MPLVLVVRPPVSSWHLIAIYGRCTVKTTLVMSSRGGVCGQLKGCLWAAEGKRGGKVILLLLY